MGSRIFFMLMVLSAVPAAIARDRPPRIEGVVHDGSICWDPDVEFPVPCDDDD